MQADYSPNNDSCGDMSNVERECREYGGKVVARMRDGSNIYAATHQELREILESKQIKLTDVVVIEPVASIREIFVP